MKFRLMEKIAWTGVVSALIVSVITTCVMLLLFLPQSLSTTGLLKINYPATGFWWSLFALAWTLLLIIPYLAYFLRSNGWCIAFCGGHQYHNLAALQESVISDSIGSWRSRHPGEKRPMLSKRAQLVLHVFMLVVGAIITISAVVSAVCFTVVLKDPSGATMAFITAFIGAFYIATIAFVSVQLRERDKKRKRAALPSKRIRKVVSDNENPLGSRWGSVGSQRRTVTFQAGSSSEDSEYSDSASESEGGVLFSDGEAVSHRSTLPLDERHISDGNLDDNGDDLVDNENDSPDDDGLTGGNDYEDDDDDDMRSLLSEPNIVASQLSGHNPFSLAKVTPENSCGNLMKRTFVVFGFVILALLVCLLFVFQLLAVYQVASVAVDSHLVPPTGIFYSGSETSLNKMRLDCRGRAASFATPTVIIETNWESVAAEWDLVVTRLLADKRIGLRVCFYDRAGYGWSAPGPKPREAKVSASELQKILADAKETGPLILVSNGYGAFVSRVFADSVSNPLMAAVMVDALHENEVKEYFKALRINEDMGEKLEAAELKILLRKKMLAPLGIPRIQLDPAPQLSHVAQRRQIASKGQLSYYDAVWSEFDNMFSLSRDAVARTGTLGTIPLSIVVSEYRINGTCEQNKIPAEKCSIFYDVRDELGDIPMRLQRDLLGLSTKSELIMARESSSNVHLEQPHFLADVIVTTALKSFDIILPPI